MGVERVSRRRIEIRLRFIEKDDGWLSLLNMRDESAKLVICYGFAEDVLDGKIVKSVR